MKYSMIATWKMSFNGLKESIELLKNGIKATDAVVHTIHDVEANKAFHSVGYSGLPNEEGIIQCDAGFMDGSTLQVGAIGAIENIIHAVDVARLASKTRFNNVLVGEGANKFAKNHGFVEEDLMTEETMKLYLKRKNEDTELKSYDGIVIDNEGRTVTVDGKAVELSFREYELLKYLLDNENIALSRDKILNTVWNYDYYGDSRTIDSHIKKIRHKLGKKGKHIQTIRGIGYKFEIK